MMSKDQYQDIETALELATTSALHFQQRTDWSGTLYILIRASLAYLQQHKSLVPDLGPHETPTLS